MVLSDLTVSLLLAVLPTCAIAFGLYSTYRQWVDSSTRDIHYPPGPPAGSFLGKASIFPTSRPWLTYVEWGKKYGDILHLNIYGQHIIVLNAVEDAVELLERRSGLYSDRPKDPMITLMGWDFNVELMPYGQQWRAHRKLFQHCFRSKSSIAYRTLQSAKINDLLYALLTRPGDFRSHCKETASAIMMATLYDNDLKPDTTDYFTKVFDEGVKRAGNDDIAGVTFLKLFPILRYLPTWSPGARFKRSASGVKQLADRMRDIPIDYVGKGLLNGTVGPSLVSDLLENCYVQKEFDMVKHLATSSCVGGIDTVASSLTSFFLAMALFPAVQKKAQEKIDMSMGMERLPTFNDRTALPYLEAIYRELMRWAPVFPLITAHVSTEDDIYKGFYIPKGSNVVANVWSMTRNEEKYPEPEAFNPDRFLDAEGNLNDDDTVLTFGFGRRICPGRHMATATLWLAMVSVLATFDIRKKTDENGKEIPIDRDYADALRSRPGPFECSITPRRGNSAKLIREVIHTISPESTIGSDTR
ncbi:cytochrome P450 [Gymnopilus junonius]|uniref:Cytochrome P450 n=1 Tax=Gymnopilus junonius TaxID=109634 RepID=A0A9P5NQK3_GYMJU|nr:cytochrome P450 [Gymnopilus junonius]